MKVNQILPINFILSLAVPPLPNDGVFTGFCCFRMKISFKHLSGECCIVAFNQCSQLIICPNLQNVSVLENTGLP